LSLLFVSALELLNLPAALFLGSMAAAAVLAVANTGLHVPPRLFVGAQAVLGCMIARAFPLSIFTKVAHDWPIFLGGVLSVIAASAFLGWLLTRWQVLPGSTAIWGTSPGAATAMTLMAESYGADIRLVALMQYLRVVVVAVLATIVARLYSTSASGPVPHVDWFPHIDWLPFAATAAVIIVCAIAGSLLRIPAGPLLAPMVVAAVLQDAGIVRIELPPWLLALAYLLVGWSIGSRFDRPILAHAAKTLPRLMASILCLVAVCGVFAALLVPLAGVDLLTAYLATSPGGADSVAIIAASTHVDVPFVLTMQTLRFLLVMLTGPGIARLLAASATKYTSLAPNSSAHDQKRSVAERADLAQSDDGVPHNDILH
jgi:membrane AbrB-like protein